MIDISDRLDGKFFEFMGWANDFLRGRSEQSNGEMRGMRAKMLDQEKQRSNRDFFSEKQNSGIFWDIQRECFSEGSLAREGIGVLFLRESGGEWTFDLIEDIDVSLLFHRILQKNAKGSA